MSANRVLTGINLSLFGGSLLRSCCHGHAISASPGQSPSWGSTHLSVCDDHWSVPKGVAVTIMRHPQLLHGTVASWWPCRNPILDTPVWGDAISSAPSLSTGCQMWERIALLSPLTSVSSEVLVWYPSRAGSVMISAQNDSFWRLALTSRADHLKGHVFRDSDTVRGGLQLAWGDWHTVTAWLRVTASKRVFPHLEKTPCQLLSYYW